MRSCRSGAAFKYSLSFRQLKPLIVILISSVCLCSVFTASLSAETFDSLKESVYDEFGLDDLTDKLPSSVLSDAEKLGLSLDINGIDEIFTAETLFKAVFYAVREAFGGFTGMLTAVIALSFVTFILREISFPFPMAASIVEIVSLTSCALLVFKSLYSVISSVTAAVNALTGYMGVLLPVMLGLVSAAGRPSLATAAGTTAYTAVTILGSVLTAVIPALMSVYFCLAVMAAVTGNDSVQRFSASLRRTAGSVMTFVYFIFTGLGVVGSVISAAPDGLAKRGIKYAAGTYIPVAGSYIAEGLEVWLAGAAALRNSAGVFGLAVITTALFIPLAGLAAGYVFLSGAAAISGLCGGGITERFLLTAKDLSSVLFSFTAGYGIMLCLLFTILMRSVL